MRQILPSARVTKAKGFSIPPPVGGWNSRDPLASMSEKDALYLENLIPRANYLELRTGCVTMGTVAGLHIRTLVPYSAATGEQKLFAICSDGIYDVSDSLTSFGHTYHTPTHVLDSDGFWQHVNVATAGGSFLLLVNGSCAPVYYNGSAFLNLSSATTPPLSGSSLNVNDLINVSLFKGRMIFVEKDSLSFWYGAPNAVAGTLTEYPLAVLFRKGGYLIATTSWTLDSGSGPEDRFVAITSEGEVAVFAGTDPANASTWALVGIFELARPLCRNCFCKIGGDVAVLTEGGLLSLTKALPTSSPVKSAALSDKIGPSYQEFVALYKSLVGWGMVHLPGEGLLLINVPMTTGTSQLVLNTVTGTWTHFTGWWASAMCECNGVLYYANQQAVIRALYGTDDNSAAIPIKAKTAFLGKGTKFQRKHIKLARLNITATSLVALKLGIDADYTSAEFESSSVSFGTDSPIWDLSSWDAVRWDAETVQYKWRTIAHMPGSALSLRISAQLKNISLTWNAIDFIVAAGGLL